ncbi:hypothetical protein BGZ65_012017 [Modicella reniformis]|uniref:Uncharacterized protein n=1 Tax=Modicella reniformis TaxID=1440133 RepID=A0A9P6LUY1_9FUNG|nr:hypothetical protein BGZ65_012017 [Modicella reniformis]
MIGNVIPNGTNRHGYPIRSRYDRRRRRDRGSWAARWAGVFLQLGLNRAQVQTRTAQVKQNLDNKVTAIKTYRDNAKQAQTAQSLASVNHKNNRTSHSYQALRTARQNLRTHRRSLVPLEDELRKLRKQSYYWNKVDRAAGSAQTSSASSAAPATNTAPTWDRPQAEDCTLNLDISAFITQINADSNNNLIAFSGTDYGVRTMSETVPQTMNEIMAFINHHASLWVPQRKLKQVPQHRLKQVPQRKLKRVPQRKLKQVRRAPYHRSHPRAPRHIPR